MKRRERVPGYVTSGMMLLGTLIFIPLAIAQTGPILTSIAVTPANSTINVGQAQQFTATGAFDDTSSRVLGGNTWAFKNSMSTARLRFASGVLNGLFYAVGGQNLSGLLATVEAYDPSTDSWAAKAPMSTERVVHGIGVLNGLLYAMGGQDTTGGLSTVEAYDPISNSWTPKAPMQRRYQYFATEVVNNILYVLGGYDESGVVNTVEAYDPLTDSWATKAPMPTARYASAAGVVNGLLYVIGGYDTSSNPLPIVEVYDFSTDTWTTRSPMPTARGDLAVRAVNGILYAVGGAPFSGAFATVESYDPATDTWLTDAPMPTDRWGLGSGVVNGVLYVAGGGGSGGLSSIVMAFAPPEARWSSTNTSAATIDANGLATAAATPGSTTIKATSGSVNGSASLTVGQATYLLSVSVIGHETNGKVKSNPKGINCPSDCVERYKAGMAVILTAAPGKGERFVKWLGTCEGQQNPCTLTMNADQSVTGIFKDAENNNHGKNQEHDGGNHRK